jgi:hypothetical protein
MIGAGSELGYVAESDLDLVLPSVKVQRGPIRTYEPKLGPPNFERTGQVGSAMANRNQHQMALLGGC